MFIKNVWLETYKNFFLTVLYCLIYILNICNLFTGFECRCGNIFCGVHRYSDVHSCSYNYKADAAEKIRKENPVVVGEKIQKI